MDFLSLLDGDPPAAAAAPVGGVALAVPPAGAGVVARAGPAARARPSLWSRHGTVVQRHGLALHMRAAKAQRALAAVKDIYIYIYIYVYIYIYIYIDIYNIYIYIYIYIYRYI